MNVPGRNSIVIVAIVIIDELSCLVSSAIVEVKLAMSKFVLLSSCDAMLNTKLMMSFVRSLKLVTHRRRRWFRARKNQKDSIVG
jgi:hypothetical protein